MSMFIKIVLTTFFIQHLKNWAKGIRMDLNNFLVHGNEKISELHNKT